MRSSRNRYNMKDWWSPRTKIVYDFGGTFFSDLSIGSNIISASKAAAVRFDKTQPDAEPGKLITKVLYPRRTSEGKWIMDTQEQYDKLWADYGK